MAGRPPLGIGRQDIAGSIASEIEGGPDGCVLLEIRRSGRVPEATRTTDDGTSPFRRGGFWIRPDRDFLVMQDDSMFGNEQSHRFVLDELARSPQGHWYPLKARAEIKSAGGKGTRTEHYTYHVDFAVKLPEELFDPQRYVGKR